MKYQNITVLLCSTNNFEVGKLHFERDSIKLQTFSSTDTFWFIQEPAPTCKGMTIMKIFLSLSERMCLMNAQPAPISTMVINSRAPFILKHVNSFISHTVVTPGLAVSHLGWQCHTWLAVSHLGWQCHI